MLLNHFYFNFNSLLKENDILPSNGLLLSLKLEYFLSKDFLSADESIDLHFRIYMEYLKDKSNKLLKNLFIYSHKMTKIDNDDDRMEWFNDIKYLILKD